MIKRTTQIILGSIVILIGIAGLFLPFLQGIILIIIGINIISPYHGQKLFGHLKKAKDLIKKWYHKNFK